MSRSLPLRSFFWLGLFVLGALNLHAGYQESYIQARTHYLAGNLVEAQARFGVLAKQVPLDFRVQRFLSRIERELERAAGTYREHTRSDMLGAVDRAWEQPLAEKQGSGVFRSAEARDPLYEKLERITIPKLHVVDTPIAEVIEILSELSVAEDRTGEGQRGVNMVVVDTEGRNPAVTITLRGLTLGRMLELVSKSVGFLYDVEDGIVMVSSKESEASKLDTDFFPITRGAVIRLTGQKHRGKGEELAGDLSTTQEEALIQQFLQRAGVDFVNYPGSSLAFEGSQLIVTQTPRNLSRIRNILSRFSETKQVEIEAKFLEVQQGALDELGFRWGARRGSNYAAQTGLDTNDNLRSLSQAFATQNFSSGDGTLIPSAVNPATGAVTVGDAQTIPNRAPGIPNAVDLATSAVATGQMLSVLGKWQLEVLVRALEQHSGTDLMSAPKLTVLSGKTADITVAQELRYPESYGRIQSEVGTAASSGSGGSAGVTITAGTPQNFQVRNVGVEMEVTPTVEAGDLISLRLEPRVTEFEGFVEYGGTSIAITGQTSARIPSGFFQPIFSTRQIRTEVTIADGATVVMGGLTREQVKEVHDKVRVLGDLPLIGRLFQSKGESSQKRNLLILVTANLLDVGGAKMKAGSGEGMFDSPIYIDTKKE